MAFIDEMRAEGYAVESVCRVLRDQGLQIAARTYRAWRQPARPVAVRTVTDALVEDKVRDLAWTVGDDGRRRLTPEGLYGRRKMTRWCAASCPTPPPARWTGRCDPLACRAFGAPRASAPPSPPRTAAAPVTC